MQWGGGGVVHEKRQGLASCIKSPHKEKKEGILGGKDSKSKGWEAWKFRCARKFHRVCVQKWVGATHFSQGQ